MRTLLVGTATLLAALLLLTDLAEAQTRRRLGGSRALRQPDPYEDQPLPGTASPPVTAPASEPGPAPVPATPPAIRLSGSFDAVVVVEAARRGEQRREAATTAADLGLRLDLPAGLAIAAVLRTEPVQTGAGQGLPPHASWVETLQASLDLGPLVLFAGKIHPRFGVAWQRAPGLYGADLAGEYELREKLGFGARLDLHALLGLDAARGTHALQIEAFRADTSLLSGSLFHPRWPAPEGGYRWRQGRDLGGADNTPGLGGAVLSLTGAGIALPGGEAGYSVSHSWREPGQDALAAGRAQREEGSLVFAQARFALPLGLVLEPQMELARRGAADGFAGRTTRWATGAVTLRRGPFALSYVQASRVLREDEARLAVRQRSINATLELDEATGLPWLAGIALSLDARRTVEAGRRSEAAAAVLVYSAAF
jgi:hypothetical protein